MAVLPSLSQVAGTNAAMYEALYQQVDPAGTDRVGAMEAAVFLKKSRLPDTVLSKVWDLSDPTGKGFLDKRGFFVALKLVALAQSGKDISLTNIGIALGPPVMGDSGQSSGMMSPSADWIIKPNELTKYEELFSSLGPVGNKVAGNLVKPIMLNSKLPTEVLGKIWELSDMDQDGFLDRDEFILAMHLMCKAISNVVIPSVLPAELLASVKSRGPSPALVGGINVMPDLLPGMDGTLLNKRSSTPTVDLKNALNKSAAPWVVGATEKAQSDDLFRTLDGDNDGFVTGFDIKNTLLQSGLPPPVLAHIWNLCDMKQVGKLSSEQFALAMYLVRTKLAGTELPQSLTPEMVPPTLRPKPSIDNSLPAFGTTLLESEPVSTGNKDLDLVNNEIKELQKEKHCLEEEISEKESELQRKGLEVQNLSKEQETLAAMLKQLEVQKAEAVKRLSDLGAQQSTIESSLRELKNQVDEETTEVENLRAKVDEQTKSLESQEEELNSRRHELNELRKEEQELENKIASGQGNLANISKGLQDTQLQISQSKAKITLLQEKQRQMEDGLSLFDGAMASGEVSSLSELSLGPPTSLSEIDYRIAPESSSSPVSFTSTSSAPVENKEPQHVDDLFGKVNGFDTDPFAGEDPFSAGGANDVFTSDPFQDAFGDVKNDPFGGSDPFDPFGGSGAPNPSSDQVSGADPFGADPFQPVAPPRPESPMPALPPKKSKAPPPRPAPPRQPPPTQSVPSKTGPTRAAPAPPPPPANSMTNAFFHDPFGGAPLSSTKDPFASAFESNGDVSKELSDSFGSSGFGFGSSDPFGGPSSRSVVTAGDPFASTGDTSANDSFANFADFDKHAPPPPYFPPQTETSFSQEAFACSARAVRPNQRMTREEERQLAWAKEESYRLELDRQQRAKKQEEADLEMALELSRREAESAASASAPTASIKKKSKKRVGKAGLF